MKASSGAHPPTDNCCLPRTIMSYYLPTNLHKLLGTKCPMGFNLPRFCIDAKRRVKTSLGECPNVNQGSNYLTSWPIRRGQWKRSGLVALHDVRERAWYVTLLSLLCEER